MKGVVVAFDVDGTLITHAKAHVIEERRELGQPYPFDSAVLDIIETLIVLSRFKNVKIVVWSGGGKDYAQGWVNRLQLGKYVWRVASKTEAAELQPDIAIDDMHACDLGKVNLIVRNGA